MKTLMKITLALIGFGISIACGNLSATELPVPKISDVLRVDRDTPPSGQIAVTMTYILKTSPHNTLGDAYVIVTDQTNAGSLKSLERLSQFHHGSLIHVSDLGALLSAASERDQLISALRDARPRFVAIAPQRASFNINMLLGMWAVLAALGDDGQLPVFPGILAAPDPAALDALVDRSIHYHPLPADQVRPFVMGQVLGPLPFGQRSLQKVRMMRNYFADYGCTTHNLVILAYTAVQRGVTVAPAPGQWQVQMDAPNTPVPAIPSGALPALNDASLLLMFGHGSPGTECSLDVNAFQEVAMTNKIVMSGDCFSAAPDEPGVSSPDGAGSFAMLAVANGATVVYAHMHENSGFPNLFPTLENWTDGLTVGEAYQRLINALIEYYQLSPSNFISGDEGDTQAFVERANNLLYAIIGDPALQPLAKMTPVDNASSAR